ncbi:SNF1 protein kinase subunit beta-3 [[Candida] railenensis]|uniref:SNF1 protein kinase subunit beta-3 n=1 Tax=[Candida] railenensis TaxID=45579 RepID=A0A9P0QQI6_9ASCO|nr:SNF1 protein kinase subunit beta-3 [[Candida] railenensis]
MSNSQDSKDISMVDVSKVLESTVSQDETQTLQPPQRRKSTLILTDEMDVDNRNHTEQSSGNSSTNASGLEDNMQVDNHDSESGGRSQQNEENKQQQQQQQQQGTEVNADGQAAPLPDPSVTIPVDIKWVQGGEKVYVTGSFTGWRKMIGLTKQPDGDYSITLGLPLGTHRFRFVIDNELRFSDYLPTATDQMGNFVNYVEVTHESIQSHLNQLDDSQSQQQDSELQQHQQVQENEQDKGPQEQQQGSFARKSSMSGSKSRSNSIWGLTNDDDDMGNGYSRYHEEVDNDSNKFQYITDIPPIFTDPKVMEQYYMAIDKQSKSQNGSQQAWLHPPQLPPHLESVILNNFNSMDNNSGALPIPNHVVLNHLATTSIKHNTLAVASIVRYKRKYVTQVLYAPLQQ